MKNFKIGQTINCKVTGIEKYGIFVSVDKKFNGLIHISEISNDFVRKISDYVQINDTIFAKIIGIDNDNYQMNLSIKDIDYQGTGKKREKLESENGFKPLEQNLPKWTEEKQKEYELQKN